jgi:chemotaxis protein methyltransferase CheR
MMAAIDLPAPNDTELQLFATLIEREAGIHLTEAKKSLLQNRLAARLRARELRTFAAYYRVVVDDPDERVRMLDAISTNETSFFREPHHFELLAKQTIPSWIAAARAGERDRLVHAWSAACSTGEEPYSLAMLLAAELPDGTNGGEPWRIKIHASDLSTRCLGRAREAIYPDERVASVPAGYRHRFLLRGVGPRSGNVRVAPEIRSLVSFERLNLTAPAYPVPSSLDLILCRNVLIYFRPELRDRVIRRLCQHLSPGGLLLLGHAESIPTAGLPLRSVAPTVYVRT